MKKVFYHFTDSDSCVSIFKKGFKDGFDGKVWFAEHPKEVWGEKSNGCLLKVQLEIEKHDSLAQYGQPIETEEVLDPKSNQWVPCPMGEFQNAQYFAIPATIVNRLVKSIKKVPLSERRRMTT